MDMERERLKKEEEIEFIPQDVDIPEEIEAKEGVKATKSQFDAKIKSDDGSQLVTSPTTRKVSIQLPTDEATLETMSKGEAENSSTWRGVHWLRMIQKALYYGWDIIRGQKSSVSQTKQ